MSAAAFRTASPYLRERLGRGVLRTAHRGAPRLAPDNTLESLRAAALAEVDFVETDVHLTRDAQLLLWHDEHLITPDGVFPIAQLDLCELRSLGIPDGTLATLPEAIEVVRGRTGLMIDLKAPHLEDPVSHVLAAANFQDALVCGGYLGSLGRIKASAPQIAVSLTPDAAFYAHVRRDLARLPFLDALTVYWRTVGPRLADAAHEGGLALLAWTVDYPQLARQVVSAGADGVTSNDLDLLTRLPRGRD